MSTLYIAEIDQLGIDAGGQVVMAGVRPTLVPPYSIPITSGQTLSPVFSAQTRFIELHPDTSACSFDVGVNPVAVTSKERLGAGERIFYPLRPGIPGLRLAVTQNT